MKTPFKLLLATLISAALCGCDATLTDVVLSVWDVEDALDTADNIEISITVDEGITEVRVLDSDLDIGKVKTLAENGSAAFELSATGSSIDVIGRSGLLRPMLQEDDLQSINASIILATPGAQRTISESPADAREDVTVCQGNDDRIFVISGFSGALARSNFVLNPHGRDIVSGPELAIGRRLAACATDDEGGLFLFGGCDQSDVATGGLLYSDDGTSQSPFEVVEPFGSAGCNVEMMQQTQGAMILNTGTTLHAYSEGTLLPGTLTLTPARFGASMVSIPGGNGFIIAGGTDALGNPNNDALLVRHDGTTFFAGNTFGGTLATSFDGSVALYDDGEVLTLDEQGTAPLLSASLNYTPTQMVGLPGNRFAFMDATGAFVEVVGTSNARITLDDPRPLSTLLSDRGGALFLVGGGVPGIDVVVAP